MAARDRQPVTREGQTGPCGVADRPVVVMTRSNVRRAKGPDFRRVDGRSQGTVIGVSLTTPIDVKRSGSDFTGRRSAPHVCLSAKPVGEPDAGNLHVRFDERGVETEP